jgi:hypothetical protein
MRSRSSSIAGLGTPCAKIGYYKVRVKQLDNAILNLEG